MLWSGSDRLASNPGRKSPRSLKSGGTDHRPSWSVTDARNTGGKSPRVTTMIISFHLIRLGSGWFATSLLYTSQGLSRPNPNYQPFPHGLRRLGARCIVAVVLTILVAGVWLALGIASAEPGGSLEFSQSVRPVLAENCGTCHNPGNPKNRVDFLKAATAKDIQSQRGLCRSVAGQLRNRTRPPGASKLSEEDRFRAAK